MAASEALVTLRGGMVARLRVLQLGWDLELRGFRMCPLGDKLQVQPVDQLTLQDVAEIHRHRDELLALVRYDADQVARCA
jgi:hypothetical protein